MILNNSSLFMSMSNLISININIMDKNRIFSTKKNCNLLHKILIFNPEKNFFEISTFLKMI